MSDRQLVSTFLQRNDQAAFAELYERHQAALLRVTRRLMRGSEMDAQDLAQDVWMKATQALARFEWRSGFRTWLFGIAMNRARDLLHQRGVLQKTTVDETRLFGVKAAGPTDQTICENIDLTRTLRLLTPRRLKVLLLSEVGGYTHREIGAHLRIGEAASKSQLSRAKKALRNHLAPAA